MSYWRFIYYYYYYSISLKDLKSVNRIISIQNMSNCLIKLYGNCLKWNNKNFFKTSIIAQIWCTEIIQLDSVILFEAKMIHNFTLTCILKRLISQWFSRRLGKKFNFQSLSFEAQTLINFYVNIKVIQTRHYRFHIIIKLAK